jgi:hypothetical protein
MLEAIIPLLYPLSSFVFIRFAIRAFGAWAERPKPSTFLLGVCFSAVTIHSGWMLLTWSVTRPQWWIQALIVLAFVWISFKNLREIWKFSNLQGNQAEAV